MDDVIPGPGALAALLGKAAERGELGRNPGFLCGRHDWVLVLDDAARGYPAPGAP